MTDSRLHLDRYDQSWFSRGRSNLVVVLWDLVQTFLIHPSPHPAYAWRRFWYRLFGAKLGHKVLIRKSVRCNYPWKVAIGDHSMIGDEAWLYALEHITIADHVVISQQAYLCTGSHDITDPTFKLKVAPITIQHGAWVALGALIMPGVTIGAGAVVGARAILTKDAAPWTVHVGQPAKPVGPRILRELP